ncbi:MAG: hypothetical protein IJT02_03800 [Synergistaceae bacterium]|nr:hypothetical protein [Synergistaceae bacterium]
MKKYMLRLLVIALFCAVTAGGCGGGHDDNFASDDSEDTAYFGDETDTESGDETVPEDDEGRGGFSSGTIKVKVDGPTAYYFEAVAFYARKNGGKWEALHSKTGDQFKIVDRNFELDVSKEYVEFGFEFSVVWGTTYPYSGVFWTAKDTARIQPKRIDIDIGGTTLNTTIKIKVNDFQVFKDTNCSEKTRYGWEGIRMELSPSQLYKVKGAILYGRTSTSSNWVKVIEFNDDSTKRYRNAKYLADGVTQEKKEDGKDTNGNQLYNYYHTYHIPENRYVEFAFECDIIGGTDYPYSDVFWTASQSASEAPHSIKIDLSGAVRNANIAIEVNNKTVFKETNLPAGKQRDWSKKDEIRVRLYKTGLYTCKSRAFYARKAGGSWECLFNTDDGDHDIYISKEYVEFGFDFDIFWGTT